MRLRWFLLLLLLLSLFPSCRKTNMQTYLASYGQAGFVTAIIQDEHLLVMLLPQKLGEVAAKQSGKTPLASLEELMGVTITMVHEGDAEKLYHLRELATTLVINTTGVENRSMVDETMMLEALRLSAGYLRKTPLTDTLASVVGFEDPLSILEKCTQILVIDLTDVLNVYDYTDWNKFQDSFNHYMRELLDYQRRSFIR